jgi:hypothetical protein
VENSAVGMTTESASRQGISGIAAFLLVARLESDVDPAAITGRSVERVEVVGS